MFTDDKWLGGTVLWWGGEMKGPVICFWVAQVRRRTLSCHRLSPLADGDMPSACLHLICVHVRQRERGEAAGLKARCEGRRVKQVLNWITFWLLQLTLFRLCHWQPLVKLQWGRMDAGPPGLYCIACWVIHYHCLMWQRPCRIEHKVCFSYTLKRYWFNWIYF